MAERIPCAHCKSTGTCTNGTNGEACAVCAKKGRSFRDYSGSPMGLVCSVCSGEGSNEPFSLKIQNRFLPIFAMTFVLLLLIFLGITLFWANSSFDKVIAFAGTLIGSITGYYFGGKQTDSPTTKATTQNHNNPNPQQGQSQKTPPPSI
jgi:hypothetical protein